MIQMKNRKSCDVAPTGLGLDEMSMRPIWASMFFAVLAPAKSSVLDGRHLHYCSTSGGGSCGGRRKFLGCLQKSSTKPCAKKGAILSGQSNKSLIELRQWTQRDHVEMLSPRLFAVGLGAELMAAEEGVVVPASSTTAGGPSPDHLRPQPGDHLPPAGDLPSPVGTTPTPVPVPRNTDRSFSAVSRDLAWHNYLTTQKSEKFRAQILDKRTGAAEHLLGRVLKGFVSVQLAALVTLGITSDRKQAELWRLVDADEQALRRASPSSTLGGELGSPREQLWQQAKQFFESAGKEQLFEAAAERIRLRRELALLSSPGGSSSGERGSLSFDEVDLLSSNEEHTTTTDALSIAAVVEELAQQEVFSALDEDERKYARPFLSFRQKRSDLQKLLVDQRDLVNVLGLESGALDLASGGQATQDKSSSGVEARVEDGGVASPWYGRDPTLESANLLRLLKFLGEEDEDTQKLLGELGEEFVRALDESGDDTKKMIEYCMPDMGEDLLHDFSQPASHDCAPQPKQRRVVSPGEATKTTTTTTHRTRLCNNNAGPDDESESRGPPPFGTIDEAKRALPQTGRGPLYSLYDTQAFDNLVRDWLLPAGLHNFEFGVNMAADGMKYAEVGATQLLRKTSGETTTAGLLTGCSQPYLNELKGLGHWSDERRFHVGLSRQPVAADDFKLGELDFGNALLKVSQWQSIRAKNHSRHASLPEEPRFLFADLARIREGAARPAPPSEGCAETRDEEYALARRTLLRAVGVVSEAAGGEVKGGIPHEDGARKLKSFLEGAEKLSPLEKGEQVAFTVKESKNSDASFVTFQGRIAELPPEGSDPSHEEAVYR